MPKLASAFPHGEVNSSYYGPTIYTSKRYFMVTSDFLHSDSPSEIQGYAEMAFMNKVDSNSPATIDDVKRIYLHGIVGFTNGFIQGYYLSNLLGFFINDLVVLNNDEQVVDANPIVDSWVYNAINWASPEPAALYPIVTIKTPKEMINLLQNLGYSFVEVDLQFRNVTGE